jgi:hypothetical protein
MICLSTGTGKVGSIAWHPVQFTVRSHNVTQRQNARPKIQALSSIFREQLQSGRKLNGTFSFSASDKLSHISLIFVDNPYVTDLIALLHLPRIGIRANVFHPRIGRTFRTRYSSFMEKSQQRVIIYCFSLKGWSTRKVQKKLTDALALDVYSQAQTSRRLARFTAGGISRLDGARPTGKFSILGRPLELSSTKFSR